MAARGIDVPETDLVIQGTYACTSLLQTLQVLTTLQRALILGTLFLLLVLYES